MSRQWCLPSRPRCTDCRHVRGICPTPDQPRNQFVKQMAAGDNSVPDCSVCSFQPLPMSQITHPTYSVTGSENTKLPEVTAAPGPAPHPFLASCKLATDLREPLVW